MSSITSSSASSIHASGFSFVRDSVHFPIKCFSLVIHSGLKVCFVQFRFASGLSPTTRNTNCRGTSPESRDFALVNTSSRVVGVDSLIIVKAGARSALIPLSSSEYCSEPDQESCPPLLYSPSIVRFNPSRSPALLLSNNPASVNTQTIVRFSCNVLYTARGPVNRTGPINCIPVPTSFACNKALLINRPMLSLPCPVLMIKVQ